MQTCFSLSKSSWKIAHKHVRILNLQHSRWCWQSSVFSSLPVMTAWCFQTSWIFARMDPFTSRPRQPFLLYLWFKLDTNNCDILSNAIFKKIRSLLCSSESYQGNLTKVTRGAFTSSQIHCESAIWFVYRMKNKPRVVASCACGRSTPRLLDNIINIKLQWPNTSVTRADCSLDQEHVARGS